MTKTTRRRKTSAGAAGLIAMAMMLVGCPDERAPVEANEPTAAATNVRAPLSTMTVEVASLRADAAIDEKAARGVARDAESAFLACLDPDASTGIVAMKLLVEGDGSVAEASALPATTYGTDDARGCFERILSVLRFPTPQSHDRFEMALSLEVRPRHEGTETP